MLKLKLQFIGIDPHAGRDWGQEEKGMTEDNEMAGSSMDMSLGKLQELVMDTDLACCDSWGRRVGHD